jgi:deazaflavin-dependent oxidoreductase (nitroreductase family)
VTGPIGDAEALKAFNAKVVDEFRANRGKVGGQFGGANLLLLTTLGAKSGQRRVSPLGYLRLDGKMIVVGAYAGADVDPAWVHNLRANPQAHIEVGGQSLDVSARELPPDEREFAWKQIVQAEVGVADYQARTSRVIPVFELVPI